MTSLLTFPTTSTRRARRALAATALALGFGAVAPWDAAPATASPPAAIAASVAIAPNAETYLGTVAGTDAYIAIVRSGTDVRGYVCDGVAIAAWFSAPLSKSAFTVTTDGMRVAATRSNGSFRGSVTTTDGVVHRFTATRPPASSTAGLYRGELAANGSSYVGGWIILPGSKLRGYIEQDNRTGTPFTPTQTGSIIAILIGRRSVEIPGVGALEIKDGTSNVR